MERVVCLDPSPTECASPSSSAPIWQDVLAHAMTGELLAAMNYASLSEICADPAEIAEALEHARNERGHAAAFADEGRKMGVEGRGAITPERVEEIETIAARHGIHRAPLYNAEGSREPDGDGAALVEHPTGKPGDRWSRVAQGAAP